MISSCFSVGAPRALDRIPFLGDYTRADAGILFGAIVFLEVLNIGRLNEKSSFVAVSVCLGATYVEEAFFCWLALGVPLVVPNAYL